jgi:hypothetical protein
VAGGSISVRPLPTSCRDQRAVKESCSHAGLKPATLQSRPFAIYLHYHVIKLSERWKSEWERPIRSLAAEPKVRVKRMIGVYTGRQTLHLNGFDVLPLAEFLRQLQAGEVF